jgi:hypothetical protein
MKRTNILIGAIIIIVIIWLWYKSTSSVEKFALSPSPFSVKLPPPPPFQPTPFRPTPFRPAPTTPISVLTNRTFRGAYIFEENSYLKDPRTNLYVTNVNNVVQLQPYNGASNQQWSYRPHNKGKLAGQYGRYLIMEANGNLKVTQADKNSEAAGYNWNQPPLIINNNYGRVYIYENNSFVRNIKTNLYATNVNNVVQWQPYNGASNQQWSHRPNNKGKLAGQYGRYLIMDDKANLLKVTQADKNSETPGINWKLNMPIYYLDIAALQNT